MPGIKQGVRIAAIAILYVLAARAGLQLDAISGFATLVWPPTGIALAALLLGGYGLWPGVFLGAVIANVLTGAPLLVAGGIGLGNTLEALFGAYALTSIPGFRCSLDRVPDAIGLILQSALSPVIAASIGVTSLYLGGIVGRGAIGETWRAWWLGDAIGAVLVAPVILVWATKLVGIPPARRFVEAIALTLAVLVASLLIFFLPATRNGAPFNQAYVFYPLLMWAAVRFAQHGSVALTFLVSVIAIWGTAMGHGPFNAPTLHGGLFALQTFMGVTAATFLVLGASTAERDQAVEDISAAHEVAADANRAKAEFLAVMSHELRTPLNAIAGYSELLSLGIAGPLSEKQADAVTRIRSNQRHLLGLIDQVLSFARVEAGHTQIVSERVPVVEAFDGLDPLIRPQVLEKRLALTRDPIEEDLSVQADPGKLRQILLNAIVNAIKFTPANGEIRLGARRAGNDVVMTIADTGIGVEPDKVARIFEPFFQVDSKTTREYAGVGLGLTIARDLARAMNGDIGFESEVGKGSVVSVTLPVAV
ncbi:MAG TPA: MASE1 domain-containing protein [Gemmatimonadaceae bacterium]|nr:MASE1 domain-containing protein [Gemmatimonadaceae bacterium]